MFECGLGQALYDQFAGALTTRQSAGIWPKSGVLESPAPLPTVLAAITAEYLVDPLEQRKMLGVPENPREPEYSAFMQTMPHGVRCVDLLARKSCWDTRNGSASKLQLSEECAPYYRARMEEDLFKFLFPGTDEESPEPLDLELTQDSGKMLRFERYSVNGPYGEPLVRIDSGDGRPEEWIEPDYNSVTRKGDWTNAQKIIRSRLSMELPKTHAIRLVWRRGSQRVRDRFKKHVLKICPKLESRECDIRRLYERPQRWTSWPECFQMLLPLKTYLAEWKDQCPNVCDQPLRDLFALYDSPSQAELDKLTTLWWAPRENSDLQKPFSYAPFIVLKGSFPKHYFSNRDHPKD